MIYYSDHSIEFTGKLCAVMHVRIARTMLCRRGIPWLKTCSFTITKSGRVCPNRVYYWYFVILQFSRVGLNVRYQKNQNNRLESTVVDKKYTCLIKYKLNVYVLLSNLSMGLSITVAPRLTGSYENGVLTDNWKDD